MVMRGYWNGEAHTRETIDPARWLHSGDLGTMDSDGYLTITGRSKDMVIRGGENIYPREVEEFLFGHPAVADAQVFGVPDYTTARSCAPGLGCGQGYRRQRTISAVSAGGGSRISRSRATSASLTIFQ